MIVTAFDPGKTGYIVELNGVTRTARTMPIPFRRDEIVCYRQIRENFDLKSAELIILEKVSVQPKWSSMASMTFGKTVGQLQMLLSAFSFAEVSSRTWQKVMHLGFSDNMKPKEKSEAAFYRLNPDYVRGKRKPSHDMIDAFLIAAYGLKTTGVNIHGGWTFDHIPKKD